MSTDVATGTFSDPDWLFGDVEDASEDELSPTTDYVVVRLGAGRYGVCAPDVAEVIAVPTLTRIPGAPAWLAGIGNWRGHVLPVVDLRPLLGVDSSPSASSARVVVLAVDDLEVGLLADAVTGLAPVPDDRPAAPPGVTAAARDLLVGLADGGSAGPIGVLGTDAVIALRDELPKVRRAG